MVKWWYLCDSSSLLVFTMLILWYFYHGRKRSDHINNPTYPNGLKRMRKYHYMNMASKLNASDLKTLGEENQKLLVNIWLKTRFRWCLWHFFALPALIWRFFITEVNIQIFKKQTALYLILITLKDIFFQNA